MNLLVMAGIGFSIVAVVFGAGMMFHRMKNRNDRSGSNKDTTTDLYVAIAASMIAFGALFGTVLGIASGTFNAPVPTGSNNPLVVQSVTTSTT